jgi:hypothetical protein
MDHLQCDRFHANKGELPSNIGSGRAHTLGDFNRNHRCVRLCVSFSQTSYRSNSSGVASIAHLYANLVQRGKNCVVASPRLPQKSFVQIGTKFGNRDHGPRVGCQIRLWIRGRFFLVLLPSSRGYGDYARYSRVG